MSTTLLLLALITVVTSQSVPSVGVVFSYDIIKEVGAIASGNIEKEVAATHPPPYVDHTSSATVTLKDFTFSVLLLAFGLESPGWQYFEEYASFQYHIKQNGFPGVAESGDIWIFTTNQNQKTLTVSVTTDFSGLTPTLKVNSASVAVESGDLFVVGHCTDTICLIPVHDIIDPIAQKLIPTLESTIVTQVQTEGNAILQKIADIVRVPVGSYTLEFNGEGAMTVLPGGLLSYTANGGVLADVNGNFIPPPVSNTVPLPNLATLPAGDIKVVISEWSIASFIWALGKTGALSALITPSNVPASLPVKLNTDSLIWLLAMPGLSKYPHMNLTFAIEPIWTWPSVVIQPSPAFEASSLSFSCSMSIVNNGKVVLANAVVLNITFGLNFTSSATLRGNVATIGLSLVGHDDSVTLISSQVGSVATASFQTLLSLAFSLVQIPPFNVTMPSGITVTGLTFSTKAGYALLLVDGHPAPVMLPNPLKRASQRPLPEPKGTQRTKSHKLSTLAHNATSPDSVQVCGAGLDKNCQGGQTCCNSAKGGFACCPLEHATCCSDGLHCCPMGEGCVNGNTECAPWG